MKITVITLALALMTGFTSGCSSIVERHFPDRAKVYPGVRSIVSSPERKLPSEDDDGWAAMRRRRTDRPVMPVRVIDFCGCLVLDTLLLPYDLLFPPKVPVAADKSLALQ